MDRAANQSYVAPNLVISCPRRPRNISHVSQNVCRRQANPESLELFLDREWVLILSSDTAEQDEPRISEPSTRKATTAQTHSLLGSLGVEPLPRGAWAVHFDMEILLSRSCDDQLAFRDIREKQ